ncbi:MAG: TIGR00288 family NYN domain-containing protein [Candidatus Diapherotrites archaeon]|nr:TIGR00288 family NYN domain-containing protein [Candidatus Diapherotrites archaeon]
MLLFIIYSIIFLVFFVFDSIKSKFLPKKKNIAVFVDGPNILRKELNIDLSEIKNRLSKYGLIKIGRVFLNQFASNKLLEAVVNQGFEPLISVGDIDVSMACDAVEAIYNPSIHSIAFVTRDSDFLPAIMKAKRAGKETIVLMVDKSAAVALKNHADQLIILGDS